MSKIIYVDIDGILCTQDGINYNNAKPIYSNINKVNELYDDGNTIVLWTARGTVTGIDWTDVTTMQLNDWNVKYHNLKFGKPAYDIFIDDKALSSLESL
jgi:histidinol phosphatase-like enzyme